MYIAKFNLELQRKIKTFQKWFRSIDIDVRYEVERFLRRALIKRLTHEEVAELVSKSMASSKGYTGAVDKNKKPS